MNPQPSNTADAVNDRIKLDLNFDVNKMIEEIKSLQFQDFIYYNAIPLRAPAHLVDPTIPFPAPSGDYANGSWTDWLDTNSLKKSTYLSSVIDTFRDNTKVTLVRLLRLAPGAVVKEHTDPTLGLHIEKSVIRLTIPIISNDSVQFYLNNEIVPLQPGECWYLRLTDPHRIINSGTSERINLTIDMIPNEWVRSLILEKSN